VTATGEVVIVGKDENRGGPVLGSDHRAPQYSRSFSKLTATRHSCFEGSVRSRHSADFSTIAYEKHLSTLLQATAYQEQLNCRALSNTS
jgi:hypothetical protein